MAKVDYSIFSDLLAKAVRDKGFRFLATNASRKWFREQVKKSPKAKYTQATLKRDRERFRSRIEVGRMYFYAYDPKWKKELPYYDRFPMIFPFRVKKDRFWGINLHYLPYRQRAILMDALHGIANNDRYDKSTKLAISYQILNNSSKFKWFRPCIKEYLTSHVQGTFMRVESSEWNIALFLPFERFQKASKTEVWKDSIKIANRAARSRKKGGKAKAKTKTTRKGKAKTKTKRRKR